MEQELKLKACDGKQIDCILNTGKKANSVVVVFVHGLTGGPHEHNYYNAARQYPSKGVDTFRFSLYEYGEKNRTLSECSLDTHAKDINTVLSYLRPKYKTVAIVGHSLGCPSILKSDLEIPDILVLWEPSHFNPNRGKKIKKITLNNRKAFVREGPFEYLVSEKMLSEWQEFDGEKELSIISTINKPLLIVAAKNGVLVEGSRKYFEVAQEPKKLALIENATHCFNEEGAEQILLKETLHWLKKYAK